MFQKENTDLLCWPHDQTDGYRQSLPRHHEHCLLAPLSRVPYKRRLYQWEFFTVTFVKIMPDTQDQRVSKHIHCEEQNN